MRHALILTVAVLAASAARAGNVVYEHPALKVRLTVHVVDGAAAPDALSYEGPGGFYLIKASELSSLERGDGYSTTRYDVNVLDADGFLRQSESYLDAKPCAYSSDACVSSIEAALNELVSRGKQEAPDEFAARVAELRRRAARTHASGTGAAATLLADAAAVLEAARAERVTGEARAAGVAPTSANPNPKADFYFRESRSLDAASGLLSRAEAAIRSEEIPNY
jgi:hypothetical protein